MVLENGRIGKVFVRRGAPCGATWEAAKKIEGWPAEEAAVRYGLEVQYFCAADPAGWDPLYGKSPVHFAGHMHKRAMVKALERLGVAVDASEDGEAAELAGHLCV